MNNNEGKHKYYSTQVMLILRVVICAYIIYQAYLLTKGYIEGDGLNLGVLITVDIIFTGIGLVLGISSLYSLVTGRYSGGKLDEIEEIEVDDEENSEDSDKLLKENNADSISNNKDKGINDIVKGYQNPAGNESDDTDNNEDNNN